MKRRKIWAFIAIFLVVNLIYEMGFPVVAFALTGGPSQPEVQGFEPVGTTQMVDLSSGDFVYNIPLLDVEGYPINISYHSGIGMDQEASWVGLGWDLNPGAVNRNMRGLPDDFNGDKIEKVTNLKPDETFGVAGSMKFELGGANILKKVLNIGESAASLGLYYNTYRGLGCKVELRNLGADKNTPNRLTVGLGFDSQSGISIDPELSLDFHLKTEEAWVNHLGEGRSIGVSYNSMAGLQALTMSKTITRRSLNSKSSTSSTGRSNYTFSNPTYLPDISNRMRNLSFSASVGFGPEFMGGHPKFSVDAYYTRSELAEKYRDIPSYGYYYSGNSDIGALLDFNREKDLPYLKDGTTNLPVTNFTYDVFSISGQGTGGVFRPYRGEVGSVFDNHVESNSFIPTSSLGASLDLGAGNITAIGGDFDFSVNWAESGKWEDGNNTAQDLKFGRSVEIENIKKYEQCYFKRVGEPTLGNATFNYKVDENTPIQLEVHNISNTLDPQFNGSDGTSRTISGPITKSERDHRNQFISTLTAREARMLAIDREVPIYDIDGSGFYKTQSGNLYTEAPSTKLSRYKIYSSTTNYIPAQPDHISEVSVTNTDGTRYVYGLPAYNLKQKEVAFDIGEIGRSSNGSNETGLVAYNPGIPEKDNTVENKRGIDHFYSSTSIPGYAHAYLLTSVVSPDYVDIKNDGVTDDDLGTAVKFNYSRVYGGSSSYKWRTPIDQNSASYNEGFKTESSDDKGSYIYGEKEIYYLHSIESKNYVALFEVENRKDGYGVLGENGGKQTANPVKALKKIILYSKKDLMQNGALAAIPIKTVEFQYSYSLCPGTLNNDGSNPSQTGKLTLEKIWITYGKSEKGRLNAYSFHYSEFNPAYHFKGYDRWGNYKPLLNVPGYTKNYKDPYREGFQNCDFPFVDQSPVSSGSDMANDFPSFKYYADAYASAWNLTKIELPSGGTINVDFESDDYAYVQNKRALQMIKVKGMGKDVTDYDKISSGKIGNRFFEYTPSIKGAGYTNIDLTKENDIIFFELPPGAADFSSMTMAAANDFISKECFGNMENLFFNFYINLPELVNFSGIPQHKFEFVSGYTPISRNESTKNIECGAVPDANNHPIPNIGYVKLELKDIGNSNHANPIAKAGWDFVRLNQREKVMPSSNIRNSVYGGNPLITIAKTLLGCATSVLTTFTNYYETLRIAGYGNEFNPSNSYIRLQNPNMLKKGGGCRVSKLTLSDEWGNMNDPNNNQTTYEYGQTYDYTMTENGKTISSGVAEYEPLLGGEENPWRQPIFYHQKHLLAPDDDYTVEEPFGESLFPAASVCYSQVTVKNLVRKDPSNNVIKRSASGKTVHSFYTSKEYPIIVNQTPINPHSIGSKFLNFLMGFVNIDVQTVTQGYTIELNDMQGKPSEVAVYGEDQDAPISKTTYTYFDEPFGDAKHLTNNVTVLERNGTTVNAELGREIDVVNDLRDSKSSSISFDLMGQVDGFLVGLLPAAWLSVIPDISYSYNGFKSSVITKVIHRTGILKETTVIDQNSKISQQNLVFDKETGQVLLSSTQNEFNDPVYTMQFPAHWAYKGMGQAYDNYRMRIENICISNGFMGFSSPLTQTDPTIKAVLNDGDKVVLKEANVEQTPSGFTDGQPFPSLFAINETTIGTYWVYINRCITNPSAVLIDSDGKLAKNYSSSGGSGKSYLIEVIQPGKKNQAETIISSITSLSNPIQGGHISYDNVPVINSSVATFNDEWAIFCCGKNYHESPTALYADECTSLKPCNIINPYRAGIYGNWRSYKPYIYVTDRNQQNIVSSTRNNTNVRKDGAFFFALGGSDMFWQYDTTGKFWVQSSTLSPNWQYSGEAIKYSPFGKELENKDALGRYSAAVYGYDNSLPVIVASNAQYKQVAFDGFEDYYYYLSGACKSNPHWSFLGDQTLNNLLSSDEKHSGRYSLKVTPEHQGKTYVSLINETVSCTGSDKEYKLLPKHCIGTFSPNPGKYWISVWVKESGNKVFSYTHSKVVPELVMNNGSTVALDPSETLKPSGSIIEGWQKIEGVIDFSSYSSSSIKGLRIKLVNTTSPGSLQASYFDDIRIQPFTSNVKSYVYDAISQRLLATLDENNYATYYEYDLEGNLARIKKETTEGVVTIQESRQNLRLRQ